MNQQALETARSAIEKNFGNLDDLSEELQNTIANIYYNGAIFGGDLNMESLLFDGNKTIEDSTFYIQSAKSLPGLIKNMREEVISKGNQKDIDFINEVMILMFKYRIKNVSSKPLFYARILRLFSKGNVNEIPNLHHKLTAP